MCIRDRHTTLLQRGAQVLPPLDADMAAEIHAYLRGQGVELRLGARVSGFSPQGDGLAVELEGGERFPADLVLLGIGVAPDTELARRAGLALGVKGAISVDGQMRTSAPDVYACLLYTSSRGCRGARCPPPARR